MLTVWPALNFGGDRSMKGGILLAANFPVTTNSPNKVVSNFIAMVRTELLD